MLSNFTLLVVVVVVGGSKFIQKSTVTETNSRHKTRLRVAIKLTLMGQLNRRRQSIGRLMATSTTSAAYLLELQPTKRQQIDARCYSFSSVRIEVAHCRFGAQNGRPTCNLPGQLD